MLGQVEATSEGKAEKQLDDKQRRNVMSGSPNESSLLERAAGIQAA